MTHSNKYYIQNSDYSKVLESQPVEIFKKYSDFIKKYSKSKENILDVGCGTGTALSLLLNSERELFGVDLSLPSTEIALQKGLKNIQCYDGDILPFKDGKFAVVGSHDVLEHVENPEKFLKEQVRVLKIGGYLIIVCPNFLAVTNSYHHRTAGLVNKLRNFNMIFMKIISGSYKFEKMQTVVRDVFQSDDDACNLTNPIDVERYINSLGLKTVYWSSCSFHQKGIKELLDFGFFKYFFGSLFMVFKKLK